MTIGEWVIKYWGKVLTEQAIVELMSIPEVAEVLKGKG